MAVQNIKSVLIALTKESGPDETSSALAYGLSLAQQAGAHATVQAASVKLALNSAWVSKFAAGLVHAENQRLDTLAQAVARSAQADAAAAGVTCSTESPHLAYPYLLSSFRAQARCHDLTILDAEPEALSLDRGLFETLLMESGRPLIVVPPGLDTFSAQSIIVAWDGSAQAARAISDALPFLRAAKAVEVVSVIGEKDLQDAIERADIAPHLARHGVRLTVNSISAQNGDVAQTLRNRALEFRVEMIVMGGYVHSRLHEMVFGGVTQSLLKSSSVSLFMSY
jgi:nucleotide-binding universal stress UspA family protein